MSKHLSENLEHLDYLHSELIELKEMVRESINSFPDDLKSHRVYCSYAGKILETIRTRIQAEIMDPDWLLSEALKTIALFLAEHEEVCAASLVGNHVEEIEGKVKQLWLQSEKIKVSNQNIKQGSLSKSSLNHLEKPVRRKKKNSSNK